MRALGIFRAELEVECRLRHAKSVLNVAFKLNPVVVVGIHVAQPAQVDDEAIIDVGCNGTVFEGVTMDLTVERCLSADRNIYL